MDNRAISEMRNLGPVCEEVLSAAGIETAQQVIQLGIEVLCGRLVEYSSTAERRWTMVDGKYTSRGNGVNAT